MPAPPQVNVLYQFSPPTDSWTGQEIYFDTWSQTYKGTITDTYDFYQTADYGATTTYCYLYKEGVTNLGLIHRIKCKFSVSRLPNDADGRAGIISLGTNTFGSYYFTEPELMVRVDGRLELLYEGVASTQAISAGTLYDAEIYIDVRDVANSVANFYLYINGELWVTEQDAGWWDDWLTMASYLSAGPDYWDNAYNNWPDGSIDVTTHVQDIVWTMEDSAIALGRWTMLALL